VELTARQRRVPESLSDPEIRICGGDRDSADLELKERQWPFQPNQDGTDDDQPDTYNKLKRAEIGRLWRFVIKRDSAVVASNSWAECVCEDSSRLVPEKTSAPDSSHRAFTTCADSSGEGEELDKPPHALSLTAARKSLGSC
jgi:hypothetical protein